jgi:hypothetical protein
MPTNNSDNDDTLVWGARAIGLELNLPPQKTFYQLERGRIEGASKMGDRWAAPRRKLRRLGNRKSAPGGGRFFRNVFSWLPGQFGN